MLYHPKRSSGKLNQNISGRVFGLDSSKREQIKSILLKRIKSRLQDKLNPEFENYINNELNTVTQSNKLNGMNLLVLEKNLKSKIEDKMHIQRSSLPEIKKQKESKEEDQHEDGYLNQNKSKNEKEGDLPSETKTYELKSDPWHSLIVYENFLVDRDKKMKIETDRRQKEKMRQTLMMQIEEKKKMKEAEAQKESKIDNEMIGKLNDFYQKEDLKKYEIREKNLKEKAERLRQLDEIHKQRKIESERNKDFDKELVQKAKKDIEDEKVEIEKRKIQAQKRNIQNKMENDINKQMQEEIKKKEKDEDIRLQNLYLSQLNEAEKKRQEELEMREKRVAALVNFAEVTYAKEELQKKKELDRRIMQESLKKEQKDMEEDKKRHERRKKEAIANRLYLEEQKRHKLNQRIEEKNLNSQLGEQFKKESEKEKEEEKKKAELSKQFMKKYYDEMKLQIETKKIVKDPLMTENEIKINKELLDNAEKILIK